MDEKQLRRLSCADLRKFAKDYGINANMKTEKIIEELLQRANEKDDSFITLENKVLNSCQKNKIKMFNNNKDGEIDTPRRGTYTVDDEDSFVVLERQIVNSSRKNKENLFDEDQKKVSDTPRRETYTVDESFNDMKTAHASVVELSASPELKPIEDSFVKSSRKSRGSLRRKTLSKRKVSFVTPVRRSARLSAATPIQKSIKDRPKTPMPAKLSSGKKRQSSDNKENDAVVLSLDLNVSDNVEPKTSSEAAEDINDSSNNKSDLKLASSLQQLEEEYEDIDESPKKVAIKIAEPSSNSVKKSKKTPPGFKKLATPISTARKNSPRSVVKSAVKPTTVRLPTPGLKRLATPISKQRNSPKYGNKSNGKSVINRIPTPGIKRLATPITTPLRQSQTLAARRLGTPISRPLRNSPRSGVTSAAKSSSINRSTPRPDVKTNVISFPLDSLKHAVKTPNFSKLHKKNFDKMESIGDYKKRKEELSSKKQKEQQRYHTPAKFVGLKKPAEKNNNTKKVYAGIPFVPVIAGTRQKKFNFQGTPVAKSSPILKAVSKRIKAGNVKAIKKAVRENASIKQRNKFDLKASLARKLPYKPHSGPLKPLGESNLNTTTVNSTPMANRKPSKAESLIITANRVQTREVLRGVRKNKRFMLQMNNRRINTSSLE